jgi:hypothetical protein
MTEPETVGHAERVAATLDEFIGLLFIARTTGALWGVLGHKHPIAAAHALIMSEGTILITLRRFYDLWKHHVERLLGLADLGFKEGQWLVTEIDQRNLRKTANKLFAHYAERNSDLPLTHQEIIELLHSNGWATEQEVLEWAGQAMWRIAEVAAAIRAKYSLPGSEPKAWMLDSMKGIDWVLDQIRERYSSPASNFGHAADSGADK